MACIRKLENFATEVVIDIRRKDMKMLVALDYGRATMACFYGEADAEVREPKSMTAEGGEPSGFADMTGGRQLLGDRLFYVDGDEFGKVVEFHVDIKSIPTEANRPLQVAYVRAWRLRLLEKFPSVFHNKDVTWVVGIPAEWNDPQIRKDFGSIFIEAGYSNLILVRESDAALVYAQKTSADSRGARQCVGLLCIDMGAYSNDATYVNNGETASIGGCVGASLIERMLLWANLRGEYRLNHKTYNSAQLMAEIRRRCEKGGNFYDFLLLQARRLKEEYCKAITDGERYVDRDFKRRVDLGSFDKTLEDMDEDTLVLYANEELMRQIVSIRSVRNVLGNDFGRLPEETRRQLGDLSWTGCFGMFLGSALQMCPDWSRAARMSDSVAGRPVMILTGGAALMPWVMEEIASLLPGVMVQQDPEPMTTIAKGLWYCGLRAMDIEAVAQALQSGATENSTCKLDEVCRQAYAEMIRSVSNVIAGKLADCVVDAYCDHAGKASADIVSDAKKRFNDWYSSEMFAQQCTDAADACARTLKDSLNKAFCEQGKLVGLDVGNAFLVHEKPFAFVGQVRSLCEALKNSFDAPIEAFRDYYIELNDLESCHHHKTAEDTYPDVSFDWCRTQIRGRKSAFAQEMATKLQSVLGGDKERFVDLCRAEFNRAIDKRKATFAGA